MTERLSTHARMNGFILMLSNMLNTVSTFFNTTWVRMVIFLQPTGDMREAAHSWRPLTGISRSPKPQPVQRGATSGDTWESLVAQVCPGKRAASGLEGRGWILTLCCFLVPAAPLSCPFMLSARLSRSHGCHAECSWSKHDMLLSIF